MHMLARLGRYPKALAKYTQLEAILEKRGTVPHEETKSPTFRLRAKGVTKPFSGRSSLNLMQE